MLLGGLMMTDDGGGYEVIALTSKRNSGNPEGFDDNRSRGRR